eukprot:2883324-Alexandrium_andersonii.AAC.1
MKEQSALIVLLSTFAQRILGLGPCAMATEPPVVQPSATWTGVRWAPFEPTKPSIYTQHALGDLPPVFHQEEAAKLGLSVECTEVVLALQLPDCM